MPRTMTSIVATLVLVFFAGPGLGADITLTPVTFTSEGAPVQAMLYQPAAGATKQPALVLSPGRIGIIGHSRGGMASLLAAANDARVRSTVALSPPTDHVRYVRGLREYSPSRYAEMVKSHGGTPEEAAEYYREISAVTYADRIKTPVLLVHGTSDLVAPHDHSQWMYEALVKAGNPRAKLELLRGVGHFFEQAFGGYRYDRVVELTTSWFAETLK